MSAVFLDTNILLYAASNAEADAEKKQTARGLILKNDILISTQVVQEYIANALRKPELGIGEKGVERFLEGIEQIEVVPITVDLLCLAWGLRTRYTISHWDASILAAAVTHGCSFLYSEDLQAGFRCGSTRVVNPFAS